MTGAAVAAAVRMTPIRFTSLPGMSAYCAAKAGVEHFGNALRLELAHHGVGVGTAHPGWVDTDLVRDAKDDLPSFRYTATLPYWLGRAKEELGMKALAVDHYKAFLALRPNSPKDALVADARKRAGDASR